MHNTKALMQKKAASALQLVEKGISLRQNDL